MLFVFQNSKIKLPSKMKKKEEDKSFSQIKLICKYVTDQVDPQVARGSTWSTSVLWIKLIHDIFADQLDP